MIDIRDTTKDDLVYMANHLSKDHQRALNYVGDSAFAIHGMSGRCVGGCKSVSNDSGLLFVIGVSKKSIMNPGTASSILMSTTDAFDDKPPTRDILRATKTLLSGEMWPRSPYPRVDGYCAPMYRAAIAFMRHFGMVDDGLRYIEWKPFRCFHFEGGR